MRCTLIAAVTAVLASRAIAQCPPGTETYHVAMHDSYGDGWSGNYININNCTGGSMDRAHLPMTLDSGSLSEEKFVCLPEGDFQYDLYVGGGTYTYEISWEIYEPGCSSSASDCPDLWHNDTAGNDYFYNTCPTPAPTACDGEKYTVTMSDSWGDGWGTSSLRIYDCLGELLRGDITLEDGSLGTEDVCLPAGTTSFQVECGGSSYFEYEISWSIEDKDGNEVLSGGAPVTIADGDAPSLCQTCKAAGGSNVTVLVNHAHVEDGGEWYDAKADSFAAVAFDTDGLVLLTSVIDDTNNPTWDQYLYFGCVFPGLSMKVLVYDYDLASSDDLLVSAEWADWEDWPEGEIKRLNDTQSSSSNAYTNEYFVEVAYYKGAVPVITNAPAPAPTLEPVPKPTSTPGTPTPAPTKSPVHTYDDDKFKNLDDKYNFNDGDDKNASSSTSSAGAVVGWVFGLLALMAACGGGWYWATQQAAKRGHGSAWQWANASVVDPYSPMNSASMESTPSGLTLQQLRDQHANAVSPMHTATSSSAGGFASGKSSSSSSGGKTSSGGGAYMPPVLATAMEDDDDEEEEEVAIGGVGKYSASV